MRPYLLIGILLLTSIYCPAQHAVVAAMKMNVVYIGVPNTLQVSADNCPCKSLVVTCDNGKLEKARDCVYDFFPAPESKGQKAVITVSKKQDKTMIALGKAEFRVKQVPVPTAMLAGKSEGKIPLAVLRAQSGLLAGYEGFDFDSKSVVTHFSVALFGQDGHSDTLSAASPYFTPEMKQLFANAHSGDQLVFFKIKGTALGQQDLILFPFTILVD